MNKHITASENDVAVIGIACRFPDAVNYRQYWKNIIQSVCSIREIPPDRWDWREYWGDPVTEVNKSNSKWGAFIDDVDCFDASFFKMSATEVRSMDPQQRIMMELTWSCLEDAGIAPSTARGSDTAVYIGVFDLDFKELQEQQPDAVIEAHHTTGSCLPVIANRISYFYNFAGPSMPVNTACSASLHAVHQAIQSIQQGECSMALAGGICLLLTPTKYISFSKSGMLSPSGSSRPFDKHADGFVRGEGAGLILLKSLAQAQADGNHIYAVIKGSAVNHCGKSYSLTYPDASAQAAVIRSALRKAALTADTISYVETHGTGTPKGDPVEFNGLSKAFAATTDTPLLPGSCSLGGVKANIGHLESAAGIAGIIKTILMLKHQYLPGQANFKECNPNIQLKDAPFYIQETTAFWPQPLNSHGQPTPRRAGVSSFGFGGTNCHVVLEEAPAQVIENSTPPAWNLVCLSAKTPQALRELTQALFNLLIDTKGNTALADIAYTMAIGREHFVYRIAIVTDSIAQLIGQLKNQLDGDISSIKKIPENTTTSFPSELYENVDDQKTLIHIADAYLQGHLPDWDKLFRRYPGKRISLPGYPFAKDRYAIRRPGMNAVPETSHPETQASPLVLHDHSNFPERLYSSTFDGHEVFIRDHKICHNIIFPGVLYLEMAREAVAKALDLPGYAAVQFRQVSWVQPFILSGSPRTLYLQLSGTKENIQFSFYADAVQETTLVARGNVATGVSSVAGHPDLFPVNGHQKPVTGEEFYDLLQQHEYQYGPAFRAVASLNISGDSVQANIELPEAARQSMFRLKLNPAMLDGALQATVALFTDISSDNGKTSAQLLPSSMESLTVFDSRIPATVVARRNPLTDISKGSYIADIDLADKNGNICIAIKGFCARKTGKLKEQPLAETVNLHPVWEKLPVITNVPDKFQRELRISINGIPQINLSPSAIYENNADIVQVDLGSSAAYFTAYASAVLEKIKQLAAEKTAIKTLLQVLISIDGDNHLLWGLSGMLATAAAEFPWLNTQLIGISGGTSREAMTTALSQARTTGINGNFMIQNNELYIHRWEELPPAALPRKPWKQGGIYLITGGNGALAQLLTKEIQQTTSDAIIILACKVVPANPSVSSRVFYQQADVSDLQQMHTLATWINNTFGRLDGIIHTAGIIRDNYIPRKTTAELEEVLAPKVQGLVNLDIATAHFRLDIFLLYGSMAGALGNGGQADYATANAFMSAFATNRNMQVSNGKRYGKTLCIAWPLWKEGSMKMPEAVQELWFLKYGVRPMPSRTAFNTLYSLTDIPSGQVLVLPGEADKIRKIFLSPALQEDAASPTAVPGNDAPAQPDSTQEPGNKDSERISRLQSVLLENISTLLSIPSEQLDTDTSLDDYGFDSILYTRLISTLNNKLGTALTQLAIMDHNTIGQLTAYLLEAKPDIL